MTEKLEKLTPEQEASLPGHRDYWIAKGLATGPCDRSAMEKAAADAYRNADLEPPDQYIWCLSPREGIHKFAELTDTSAREALSAACYGHHDVGWVSFYARMRSFGIKECERLEPFERLAECGWWWPLDEAAILCERPVACHLDDQGRLHHESEMAVRYQDGYGVWVWHGVRVTEMVIARPEEITTKMITEERNAEVARVMMERFGDGRYIEEIGAKPVGEKFRDSQLFEAELSDNMTIARVRAVNSTPEPDGTSRIYWLRVPPGCSCAQEALARIHPDPFRKNWRDYNPGVET